jgi:hypothetical protein
MSSIGYKWKVARSAGDGRPDTLATITYDPFAGTLKVTYEVEESDAGVTQLYTGCCAAGPDAICPLGELNLAVALPVTVERMFPWDDAKRAWLPLRFAQRTIPITDAQTPRVIVDVLLQAWTADLQKQLRAATEARERWRAHWTTETDGS